MDELGNQNTVYNNNGKAKHPMPKMRICIFDENSKTYLPLWGIWGESMLSAVEKQKPKIVMIVTTNVCYASPI